MQQRDGVAEARLEAADGLRRQRDLGHEHDHALAALERRGRGAQVDLGLARARDAVQQPRAAALDRGERAPPARRSGSTGAVGARQRSAARAAAPRGAIATRPRASSRRSAARSRAAPRAAAREQRALVVRSAARPSSGASVRAAHSSVRGLPLGGSTSDSARAGVEQYSSAIHSASSTSSGGHASPRAPRSA